MDDCATRAELAAVKRRLAVLEALVAQIARRRDADPRIDTLLPLIHAFELSTAWCASEILEDSRSSAPGLWNALDDVCGNRGDRGVMAIRLGRWLERHEGVEVDGLRLERVRREDRVWTYRVIRLPD